MRMIYQRIFLKKSCEEIASQWFVGPFPGPLQPFWTLVGCSALLSWSTNWERNIISPWRVHYGLCISNAANTVSWNRKSYYQLYRFCIWRRDAVASRPHASNFVSYIYLIWQPAFVLTTIYAHLLLFLI